MKKKSKTSFRAKYFLITLGGILVIALILFLALGGIDKTKRIYYGHKVRAALSEENKKLNEPLKALGFDAIKGGDSICLVTERALSEEKSLNCTVQLQAYTVFSDETTKNNAAAAAEKLSELLKQNGWQQGNYEVGQWFKDVLSGTDYNPDAYHSKYFDNTFCMLDFFVAYSNPSPPAVEALLRCSLPETHPPAP